MHNLGVDVFFRVRNLVDPLQLSKKNVHKCSITHRYGLFQIVQIVFWLSHDVTVFFEWNDDSFGIFQLFSGHDTVAMNKFPRHTAGLSPCFQKVCNSAFFLHRVTPLRVATGHPRLAHCWSVRLPRRSSRLSGERCDVARGPFVSRSHLRKEEE